MTALWDRYVALDVGPAGGQGRRIGAFDVGGVALDVEFDVSMTDDHAPNAARITVYNPSDDTIEAFQDPAAVIRLTVGHRGEDDDGVRRLIFEGNPTRDGVRLESRPPDRVLEVEARDGGRAYSLGHLSVSFATATTARQVFDAIADALGLPLGVVDLGTALDFPLGVAVVGPARSRLDELVASLDRIWFIRDGALNVVKADGGDTGEEAIVFSSSAGNLIGFPTPTDRGVEVRALLAPTLRPRKLFKVEASRHSGIYVATSVRFVGSSGHTPEFYVVARGVPRG